ncbi:MAG: dephospho-CoA kinase [Sporolactobacillus sp.]
MLKIGITGGIATGKSLVSARLHQLDFPVIDADALARELVMPGEPGLQRVIAHFGSALLNADGTLNRHALGALVFNRPDELKVLNALLHPLIQKRMERCIARWAAAGSAAVFLDVPLLYESNMVSMCDRVIVVYTPADLQLRRLKARSPHDADQAEARIAAQLPISEKCRRATAVIDNSGSVDMTFHQLDELLKAWQLQ